MSFLTWMEERLDAATASIEEYGIPLYLIEADLVVVQSQGLPRAYVYPDNHTIFVASWFGWLCYLAGNEQSMERLLRHELGHFIVARDDEISEIYDLGEPYPGAAKLLCSYVMIAAGALQYGDIHPEEQFCEDVGSLDDGLLTELAAFY